MALLTTINVCAASWRTVEAFVLSPSAETDEILGSINSAGYFVRNTTYMVQTLLADGFMVYRLFVVWGKNKIICVPAGITLLGCIATTIGGLNQSMSSVGTEAALHFKAQEAWNIAYIILTLFTNGYATALISARIWYFQRVQRETLGGSFSGGLGRSAAIVVESGAIYSASIIVFLVLYKIKSHGIAIMFNCLPHIIGIAFALIVVRVAAGVSHTGTLGSSSERVTNSTALIFRHGFRGHMEHTLVENPVELVDLGPDGRDEKEKPQARIQFEGV